MNHSELLKNEKQPVSLYGVDIDGLPDRFISGIKEIGIVAKADNGAINLDVLDACIGYISCGVKVILEVPYGSDLPVSEMVLDSMSAGFSISVLPPCKKTLASGNERELWDEYENTLKQYTKEWLSQVNNRQFVYPVSGFLGYLSGAVFGYHPKEISRDEYIKNTYVNTIPLDEMNKIKSNLEIVIYDCFGGKDAFESYIHSLASAIVKHY